MALTQDEARETDGYYSYENGFWKYIDQDGFHHLFLHKTELMPGAKAISCHPYDESCWKYEDKYGFEHLFRWGRELTRGIRTRHCYYFGNGKWMYAKHDGSDQIENDI